MEWCDCVCPMVPISHKEHIYLLQSFIILSQIKVLLTCPEGGGWEELTIVRLRPGTTLGFQRGIEMLTHPHRAFFQYLDKR